MTENENDAQDRKSALQGLEEWLQTPMMVLSFVWLVLILWGLIWGETGLIAVFGTAIWIAFIFEFLLRFSLAPAKAHFLKSNWLTLLVLIVPALRMFRIVRALRAARAVRGIRLVRVVSGINRGMQTLRSRMRRRGLRYVIVSTLLVTFLGAGGMLAFEPASEVQGGFTGYSDALWWTAMLLTSIGSAYWPQTAEGRILSLVLAIYGFGVFGYITASLASIFVGIDSDRAKGRSQA